MLEPTQVIDAANKGALMVPDVGNWNPSMVKPLSNSIVLIAEEGGESVGLAFFVDGQFRENFIRGGTIDQSDAADYWQYATEAQVNL